jgi:DNA gyrase subunit A
MRIVIELTRTVEPRQVLEQLYKLTPMQQTFGMNMLALVDGEPRLLPLKRVLQLFVEHRQEIITRRSRYELDKARQRAHVLEGLLVALANLDEVIATIRASQTVDTARQNLRRKFKLSEIQAQAILDMPLRRLAALERKKIEAEYKETLKRIKDLESLLRSPKKILGVIKDDLLELKSKYDSPRRTHIVAGEKGQLTLPELVPEEAVVVAVSRGGRVCRWPAEQGFEPARGQHKDWLAAATLANTRDDLYLFTEDGKAILVPAHQVPAGAAPGEGLSVAELAGLTSQPAVSAVLTLVSDGRRKGEDGGTPAGYVFLASRQGRVKRVTLADLAAARTTEFTVMKLDEGDRLGWAARSAGGEDVLLVASNGQAIRFSEEEVRPMGLPAGGVLGVKMGEKDRLVGMGMYRARGDLVVISELGVGKRSALSEYPSQGRYGVGVASASLSVKTGPLAAGGVASASDRLMMVSEKGNTKVVFVRSLPKAGRATRGQELIAIRGRDKLANLLFLPPLESEAAEPAGQPIGPLRGKEAAPRRPSGAGQPKTGAVSRRKPKAEPAGRPKPKAGQTGGRKPKAEPAGRPKPKAGQTGGRKPQGGRTSRTPAPTPARKRRSTG